MPVPVQTTKQIQPLRRAFGLFGGLRLKLDETVVPVAIVEDLVPEEWGEAFVADARGSPGVGNRGIWSLENPPGSGKLVELYQVAVSSGSATEWRVTKTSTPYVPGTILAGQWQDLNATYVVPNRYPSARMRWAGTNAAITGTNVYCALGSAFNTHVIALRVLIHPGQEIVVWQSTTDINGYLGFQWRERALLPTES